MVTKQDVVLQKAIAMVSAVVLCHEAYMTLTWGGEWDVSVLSDSSRAMNQLDLDLRSVEAD